MVYLYSLPVLAGLTAAALLWLWPAGTAEAKADARVSSVAITSSPASGDTYRKGETIAVTVTFTEAVTVTGGEPRIRLLIHCVKKTPSKDCKRRAVYTSGSGTTSLVFQYTVKNTDVDTDGVSIHKNAIRRKGATMVDSDNNKVSINNKALPAQPAHKVNGGS